MNKINKKVAIILSSTALAFGIIAIPVLAASTNTETVNQANFLPMAEDSEIIQSLEDVSENNYMNIDAMQNVHNSEVMQEAMRSGDLENMREAMNSSEIKAQLGEEVVDAMNQMMSNENLSTMHRGGMMGSGDNMMNW